MENMEKKESDKHNMKDVLEAFPEQITQACRLADAFLLERDVSYKLSGRAKKNIVFCGVGGSGLPGDIARDIVKSTPVYLAKGYELPAFADKDSLIFIISYSGNTEETLELYDAAIKRSENIVAVTSGGQLKQKAENDNVMCITIPAGVQPRMAYAYQTVPALKILNLLGVLNFDDWDGLASFLRNSMSSIKEEAIFIAGKLDKKIPLIYSSSEFSSAAYKWKINLNENSKIHAFCGIFPEWNHNEINGFLKNEASYAPYHAVFIRDAGDHPRIKKRFEIIGGILNDNGFGVEHVDSIGGNFVERLFSTIWLGDWISYYLALKREVDPTPVEMIEELKKRLSE